MLFLQTFVFAQQAQLTVHVTGARGFAINDARVTINGTRQIYTDSIGQFVLSGIVGATYSLRISKQGYLNENRQIKLESKNQSLTISLATLSHQLDEVLVKENRNLIRKGEEVLNVAVVNSDFIQRNLGGSLMKTLERLPGIKTIGIGSGQSKPLIRGLGFNRVVAVDKGIKHEGQQWGADHGLELDQFAAGEVEILKGATSFMYGSDAIAGVINVKPSRPPLKHTIAGNVDLIGKTNNNLYGTSVNLLGRNDKFFFDTRFTYQDYDDYRVPTDRVYVYDFEVPITNNYLRNTAGKETGIHWSAGVIGEKSNTVFYFSNVHSKSGFFANAHGLEPRKVAAEFHDRSNSDIQLPSQEVNHLKLINRTAYQFEQHKIELELGFQRNFRQEFNQYVNHGYMPANYPSNLQIPKDLEREFDKKVLSANLRNKFILNAHQFTIGTNLEFQDNLINGWTFLVPSFKQYTAGIFIYDQLKLNETLILQGAIRYDYGKMKLAKYTDWFESNDSQKLVRAENLTRNFNSLVWSLGVNYNPSKLFFKANIGKSFRIPIAKELGANGVNYHYFSYEKGDPGLSPEKSYQLDATLGWKERSWSLNISPFYNYFPNYIYLNPTANYDYFYGAGNQVFEYAQSKVIRYGGELEFNYKLTSFLNAEILGEYLYAMQISGVKKGFTLPFSPPPSLLLNLTYSPKDTKLFKDSYFSADYRITGKQHHIVPPEKKTEGYQVINLQIGTSLHFYNQPLRVSLQAQNLTNKKYMNHTSFYRLIALPEAGRDIVLSLKIPFKLVKHNHN
ncbi:iron complex outermembrane recepter protein [Pedobacter insulae]|uniref:Iron complex outermembrane recepter protein n=2 Tax=Pedobacter insulae TaxID=414048 RepID=A0A1I2Y5S4_9SPHI|nr:iron complex outermembrane recepter protein [Pedobacter insulae]